MEKGHFIQDARLKAYATHSQRFGGDYITNRPLVRHEEHVTETYARYLPTFNGKTLIEILNEKAQGGTPPALLDLGCGSGQALLDLANAARIPLSLTGITSYPYQSDSLVHRRKLKRKKINIKEGDIQDLKAVIPKNSMDVVVSVQAFFYLADPWIALKQTYDILKPGGVALISPFPLSSPFNENIRTSRMVRWYLRKQYGMETEADQDEDYMTVSFEKTKPHLTVPISYRQQTRNFVMEDNNKLIEYPTLMYTLDHRVIRTSK